MVHNPLIRRKEKSYTTPLQNQSAGILDDHAVRKNIATKEGTIEHIPTEDNHIANKKYVDDNVLGLHASTHEVGGNDLVDHDALTGFVGNEHIDWTNATDDLLTSGRVIIGADPVFGDLSIHTASGSIWNQRSSANAFPPDMTFAKARGTPTTPLIVNNGDQIFTFAGRGHDGTDALSIGASFSAFIDGTPGSNDMPGRLEFGTTADGQSFPTTHMTIRANGRTGFGTGSPVTTVDINGGLAMNIVTKTSNYTATRSDHTIKCKTNSFTITLPQASTVSGIIYNIKNVTSGTTITVDGNGSETIDGATTAIISSQYDAITVHCDGTEWSII